MSEQPERSDVEELTNLIDAIRRDANWRDEVSAYQARHGVTTISLISLIANDKLPYVPNLVSTIIPEAVQTVPAPDAGLNAAIKSIAQSSGTIEEYAQSEPDPQLINALDQIRAAIEHADSLVHIESTRPVIGHFAVAMETFLQRRMRIGQDRQMAVNRQMQQSIQRLTDLLARPSFVHQPLIQVQLVNTLRAMARAVDTSEPDGFAAVTWSEIARMRRDIDALSGVVSQNDSALSATMTANVVAIESQVQSIASRVDHMEAGLFEMALAMDDLAERMSHLSASTNSLIAANERLSVIEERLSRVEQSRGDE